MQTTSTPGTYAIDPAHSEVGFAVRHLAISKVHGHFTGFSGTITAGSDHIPTSLEGSVDATSVATRQEQRDTHLKSPDFFDVEKFPTIAFKSTKVTGSGKAFDITGDLTIHGVTKSVSLKGELGGTATDPRGNDRVGYTVTGKIKRGEFGVAGGGGMVGDDVDLTLEISAILQK